MAHQYLVFCLNCLYNSTNIFVGLFFAAIVFISCQSQIQDKLHYIQTVSGPIPADSLGLTLIHEHVFLDWRPADETDPLDWNNEQAFQVILPYLQEVRKYGVQSVLECTPVYLGRNPELLKRLSESSGLQILTNTGFYGYRNNLFIPNEMQSLNAGQLAEIWIGEYEKGIDGTGIKPGFIKISVEPDSTLSPFHEQIVRAAAITHRETGLTIVSHTGIDTAAALQLKLLEEEGISPSAFVWTHAQNGTKNGHVRLAKKGAWISIDGLGWIRPVGGDSTNFYRNVDFLLNMKKHGLLTKTLISHDAGWYEYGEDYTYKGYTDIFTYIKPVLVDKGFTEDDFHQLLTINPKNAYGIKMRIL